MHHRLPDQVFEVVPRTFEFLGDLTLIEVEESRVRKCVRPDIELL